MAAAVVGVIMLSPIAYLVLRVSDAGDSAWDLLFNSRTFDTLVRTMRLAGVVTLLSVALSLPLAWLTVRTDLPGRRLWSVLTALPLVVPSYVGAMTLIRALGPRGLLQQALEPWGVDRLPEIYGFHGAVLSLTFLTYPYLLLAVRTAMWGMDPTLEESSRTLGHGPWSTFRRITLPQLRPAIAGGCLLVALYVMSDFGAVSLLRFNSFTYVIYSQYEFAFDRTLAAASSLVLVALAFALVAAEAVARGRARYYKTSAGASRRAGVVRLGRWKAPALIFCAIIVGFGLVMPMGVLIYLFLQGLSAGESFSSVRQAGINSIHASALAAGVTVVAAAPAAILSVRYRGPLVWVLERASYTGFALPGIVVALAFVFFGIRYANQLYQSLTMLVAAYVVLFLPVALNALRTSLVQINPHLEEAARSLGRSPLAAFMSVTMPLLRPGIIAGAALVFLVTMKELPATLILGPTGFRTLATMTWSDADAALLARSALSAIVLVIASAVPMAAIMYWERRDEW